MQIIFFIPFIVPAIIVFGLLTIFSIWCIVKVICGIYDLIKKGFSKEEILPMKTPEQTPMKITHKTYKRRYNTTNHRYIDLSKRCKTKEA